MTTAARTDRRLAGTPATPSSRTGKTAAGGFDGFDGFDVDAATFFTFAFPAAADEATFAATFRFDDLGFEVTLTVAAGTLVATAQGPKDFFGKTVRFGLFAALESATPDTFFATATFDTFEAGFVTGQATLGACPAIRSLLRGGDQAFLGAVTA